MIEGRALQIFLTQGAESDLRAIYDYMRAQRGADEAATLVGRLSDKLKTLVDFPERGAIVRELATMTQDNVRQLSLPPYRLVYLVDRDRIFVLLVADGRRDLRALLQTRLLAR